MNDYIRLPRSALSDDLWRNGNLARLLVYLLTKADESGEIKTDMAEIARDLVLSRQNVRTLLAKIDNQILTKSVTTRVTKLKLDIQEDKPKRQPRKQPNHQPNTNQITSSRFTPPTEVQVAEYVAERGFHFNPASFIPFYESKGWKIGKEPMKDWKAACRTWEIRWIEKYGESSYRDIQSRQPVADRYSARRGTDVGNVTESDYGGAF